MAAHCTSHRADDPIFCSVGRSTPQVSRAAVVPPLLDKRVRAVAVLAPMGVAFSAESLAAIRIPTAIYDAELDRFLVARFHADWVAKNAPNAQRRQVKNAWHFAFMDPASMPIGSEDGDISANPPGFDRQAFLQQLGRELPAFFDKAFN